MPISKPAAFGLILALLPIHAAEAEWRQSRTGDWKAAYSCDAREETCVALTCEPGRNARFGLWSTQFAAVDPGDMRQVGRFEIDVDGAATSFPVEDGEYLSEKRVIFWPMDRQFLRDVEGGTTLSLRGWGDPRIDLRDNEGSIGRTLEGCSVVDPASVDARKPDADLLRSAAVDAGDGLSLLKNVMPSDAACERSGEGASCRVGETANSSLNSLLAQFDGGSGDITIRAEIAHGIGDHEGYRDRLYDILAGFEIPQSFADRCLLQGAVTLDVAGYGVECDSYTPPNATIATFRIGRL
ncbi:hypothetical protein [Jiella pacifica]|uniref:Uncharacterized protein n=1 Tax=Jiella pacifica TaxID=2696469 RepID=A0A6N9T8L7_9HYPH|nr:hypothetical protein [Jiella pacifica]NDW07581.1 hypothetical protein [Jiella pacifica]